jgi:hypothetical protein
MNNFQTKAGLHKALKVVVTSHPSTSMLKSYRGVLGITDQLSESPSI